MFPHTGLFNPNPYPATAEAIVDTHLLAIPVRQFEQLIMNTPSIAIKMMRVMGDKIRELQEKLQVLSGHDIKHRVLSFLQLLAEQHGQTKENRITINLPMTHQEFADSVGTTRETTKMSRSPHLKHKVIFETFNNLKPSEAMLLINDHDPVPLRLQFESMHTGQFSKTMGCCH
jgi:hypothetical protein